MSKKFILQSTYCNYNYGSTLQCYATQLFFEKAGFDCKLINENYSKFERVFFSVRRRLEFWILSKKYPTILLERNKMLQANKNSTQSINEKSLEAMSKFIDKHIKTVSTTYYHLRKISRSNDCLMCIAGSDQIWNGTRVYVNPVYFLGFAPYEKRVSFAPSFGTSIMRDYNYKRYSKYLDRFNRISVREEAGKHIIEELTEKEATVIMDPVFLLSAGTWRQQYLKEGDYTPLAKYVFSFFLDEPSEKAIRRLKYYYDNGFQILSLGYNHERYNTSEVNVMLLDGGPELFINLIDKSECVVTDSFHATAFSTIFHKNFEVYKRQYIGSDQSERLVDFLKKGTFMKCLEPEKAVLLGEDSFKAIDEQVKENYIRVCSYLKIKDIGEE